VSIGAVIKVLRGTTDLARWCGAVVVVANVAAWLIGGVMVDEIIGVWASSRCSARRLRFVRIARTSITTTSTRSGAQHAEDDRRRGWHSAVDRAYASIRSGFVDQGTTRSTDDRGGGRRSRVTNGCSTGCSTGRSSVRARSRAHFVVRLIEEKREPAALDLIQQCRRLSPTFEVPPEIAASSARTRSSAGRLAEELAAAAASSAAASSAAASAATPSVNPRTEP
jgi:hypothetical protein